MKNKKQIVVEEYHNDIDKAGDFLEVATKVFALIGLACDALESLCPSPFVWDYDLEDWVCKEVAED